jgi:diguanylate cyclase (GGDEF)-like protein
MQAVPQARQRRYARAFDAGALAVFVAFAVTGIRLLWPIVFIVLVGRTVLLPSGIRDAIRALVATVLVSALLAERGGALAADLALMPAAALLGFVEAASAAIRDRERGRVARDRAISERLLATDPLTGLSNRRHLRAVLEEKVDGHDRPGIGAILVDIDHFKRINDTFGHLAGDAVLVEVARRLREAAPADATVVRFGGEEFAIVVDGDDQVQLIACGDRIRRSIGAMPILLPHGSTITVDGSAGVAHVAAGEEWLPDPLLADADRALYAAKRRGRGRLCAAWQIETAEDDEPDTDLIRLARALSIATSVRDRTGPLHDLQVSDLSRSIAREMGLAPDEVLGCRLAGLLLDVGKVALPDTILTRSGALDPAEWALMRRHPEIGSHLLGQIAGLEIAIPGVRHHHERWDGAGYPDGLAGDEIPVIARVVAVADAFSAMTSDRPHRHARPTHAAIEQLHEGSGTQFDPSAVDAVLAVLDDIRTHRRTAP